MATKGRTPSVALLALMSGCSWISVKPLPKDYAPPAIPECTSESWAPGGDVAIGALGALTIASGLSPTYQGRDSERAGAVVSGVLVAGVGMASAVYGFMAINGCKPVKDAALAKEREAAERSIAAAKLAEARAREAKTKAEAQRRTEQEQKDLEETRAREAALEAEKAAIAERSRPTWRSEEGYQKTLWGMSQQEVKKFFNKARGDPAILSMEGPVAGLPARTSFYFAQDRLTDVNIRFSPVGQTRSWSEAFDALQTSLTEKYGEPDDVERSALNGDPTTTWSTENTTITLMLNSLGVLDHLVLTYSSKELGFLKAKLDDKAKEDL